ncbi:uncharacterized protein LOC135292147 [Passer domesticus]|uniref:uncharacterized protein LOC135292147 n=1 Tax=Passer domesticus TaxID=48849 RepID=UPI0030FE39AF
MAGEWGQKVLNFRISNKTRDTTLKYLRSKINCNISEFSHLSSVLPCGRSDSGHLLSHSNALGLGWLVVYEADSFTLAIFFFLLRKKPSPAPKMLQLELSLDKAHLDFRETFARMTLQQDPFDHEKTSVSWADFSGRSEVCVRLGAGHYKVTAAASGDSIPLLEVELEERAALGTAPVGSSRAPRASLEPRKHRQNPTGASGIL